MNSETGDTIELLSKPQKEARKVLEYYGLLKNPIEQNILFALVKIHEIYTAWNNQTQNKPTAEEIEKYIWKYTKDFIDRGDNKERIIKSLAEEIHGICTANKPTIKQIKEVLKRFEVGLAFEEVSDQADEIVDNIAVEIHKL